jgi:DNA-binding beta-propeller fold protein YncE
MFSSPTVVLIRYRPIVSVLVEALVPVAGSPFATGGNPYAVAVGHSGKHVFVANQLDNTLSAFSIGSGGVLRMVPRSPFATGKNRVHLVADPKGPYLYVVNADDSTLSMFKIAGDGVPTAISAPCPTDTNYFDGTVSAYKVESDGVLKAIAGSPFYSGGWSYGWLWTQQTVICI